MNDVELLDATLAQIEAHPETWDQSVWRCDTGLCFAGWTCVLAGGTWAHPESHWSAEYLVAEPDDDAAYVYGGEISASCRAERLLDLNSDERWKLFSGSSTLADIRQAVAEIKARKAAEA